MARGGGNRGSGSPFSPGRVRADLVTGLPALGMVVGALVGVYSAILAPLALRLAAWASRTSTEGTVPARLA